jgi:hypothetical protein
VLEVALGNGRGSAHGRGSGADTGAEEQRAKQGRCQRRKKRVGGPRDLVGKIAKPQRLHCKLNFPTNPKL